MADRTQFRKFRVIFRREYLERVRSKWFMVATVIGPLFFLGIMVIGPAIALRSRVSDNIANIAVLDATGTALGRRVADALAQVGDSAGATPTVVTVAPGAPLAAAESSAVAAVARNERRGYLVLDSLTGQDAVNVA